MMAEQRVLISFRPGEIKDDLVLRTDDGADDATGKLLSETARRDLERYYSLLRVSLPQFSTGEALLICDAMNGTITEPHTASLVWAVVADALEDGLAEKWHVDGEALVKRLRSLTPFEQLAVADACERFWRLVSSGLSDAGAPNRALVRAVGLARD